MDVEIKESEFMAKKGELHLLSSPAIDFASLQESVQELIMNERVKFTLSLMNVNMEVTVYCKKSVTQTQNSLRDEGDEHNCVCLGQRVQTAEPPSRQESGSLSNTDTQLREEGETRGCGMLTDGTS